MADWWKGARWQDDPAIRKYTGASLYGDFPVRPFWQATEAADVVRRCDISEGEIVRRYTLYLLELKQRKYLVHRMVLDVLSAEFETLKIVVEPKGGSPAESEDEDGETWWLRDRGDDPVGLRDCVSAMLAHVKGVRERLVLYLYACGYGYEEMPELIAAYMGRHAGAEGTNRAKTTGKSTANAVFNAKIRPLLHEHGLEGREGLDLIAETLDIEFGHSRDTMEK